MKRTIIQLYNSKTLEMFESSRIDPSIWIELRYHGTEQAFGLCNVEACRKLVEALNIFIEENS